MLQRTLFRPGQTEELEYRHGARLDELGPREIWELARSAFRSHPFLMECFRRQGRRCKLLRPRLLHELDLMEE